MNHTIDKKSSPLSLGDVCKILSVSRATAKNWIKLGKITPDVDEGEQLFSRPYIENLERQLKSGENHRLKNRRNKKSISGKSLYRDYISHEGNQQAVAEVLEAGAEFSDRQMRVILADYAVQLYCQSRGEEPAAGGRLPAFLEADAPENQTFRGLVTELLGGRGPEPGEEEALSFVLEKRLAFVPGEDTLGFVYLSLRDVSQRKTTGAYYTPAAVVSRLLEDLKSCVRVDGRTICDPCCGTGNFLMRLAVDGVGADRLYGQDSDPLSVLLLRINIALLCPGASQELLSSHFICGNTLFHTFLDRFDIILGNPPWGYAFSGEETERLKKIYRTAAGKGAESFDLFLERSVSMLADRGLLAFILPEAVLSVAAHRQVRRFLMENTSFCFVTYLGNVFSGVQCPAVVLGVRGGGGGETAGCRVSGEAGRQRLDYVVMGQREFEDEVFSFNITDEEAACIRAMDRAPGAFYLKGNAEFALGIVTGDNKEKVRQKPEAGDEAILRGNDIFRYGIAPAGHYIKYEPGQFQQVAREEYYRAPEKLLYRFISETPVFALDTGMTLTLNSCNILIPEIRGLSIKYVLAILNSRPAAFYLAKRFNSVKMLRSHLEQLPFPAADEGTQREIEKMVSRLTAGGEDRKKLYEELDERVMELYGLEEELRQVIRRALEGKNLFLADESIFQSHSRQK